jgi:hypothetical protein
MDSIAFTLLVLLKSYRHNDINQFNYIRTVLNNRNAGVVILKTLSHTLAKPYATARQLFTTLRNAADGTTPTADVIVASIASATVTPSGGERKAANGSEADSWSTGTRTVGNGDVPVCNSLTRPIIGYINLMRVLQKLTKRSAAHELMMHHICVPALLVKILAPSSPPLLRFYALKLTKSLVRYQSPQWRTGTYTTYTFYSLHDTNNGVLMRLYTIQIIVVS